MCNCLKDTLGKIEVKLKEVIPKDVKEFKIGWQGEVFRFDGGCGVGLYVEYEFRKTKSNGTLYANKTKNNSFVSMSFCPFCGESLKLIKP